MSAIWMPPQPAVVEPYGVQEVYADGGVIRTTSGMISETILYRRYGGERHAIIRILMPKQPGPPEDGFDVSLLRAYLDANGGPRH